ncbi:MAG: transposase [Ghiorsea sp.]|nr:transposase [Ghiorsea sp.]
MVWTFFSSVQGQVVPGLCFLCISLISVKRRKSFPLQMHQLIKKELTGCSKYREISTEKEISKSDEKTVKKRGRPKGRKNFNRRDVELSPYMTVLQEKIRDVKSLISDSCVPKYFLFDGELGNNFALQMVRQVNLHLICKLRYNSQLYLPWQGEYSGRGRKRIYGERLLPQKISNEYLVHETCEDGVLTEYFQIEARHKKFPDALNVVIIRKTSVSSGKTAHVILFSSDLALGWDKVVDYYRLRFQIEFNFRDAKQYWGLEDFMVVKEAKVRNSACFSMFMVNMAYALIAQNDGKVGRSMHDVKVWFLARKQVQETLKLCGENAERIFINELIDKISMKFMVNTS